MNAQPNRNPLQDLLIKQNMQRQAALEELQELWPDEKSVDEFLKWLSQLRQDELNPQ